MTHAESYPLNKLQLESDEVISWNCGQATFHRSFDFHLAITDKKVCIFANKTLFTPIWYCFVISEIEYISFESIPFTYRTIFWWLKKKNKFPRTKITIKTKMEDFSFVTPNDKYQDEREFDRKNVLEFAEMLNQIKITIVNNL